MEVSNNAAEDQINVPFHTGSMSQGNYEMQRYSDTNNLAGRNTVDQSDGLRQRSNRSNGSVREKSQVEQKAQEMVEHFVDMTDIRTPTSSVLNAFGWASVLLAGSVFGSFLGCYILHPFIGLFVGKFRSALLAAVVAPAYGFYYTKKIERKNIEDREARLGLLALAVVQGIFSGFSTSELFVSAQPLAVFFPLVIRFAYPTISDICGYNRLHLLSLTFGAVLLSNFVIGFFAGAFTGTYFLLSILYTINCALVMQLMYKFVVCAEQPVYLFQLLILTLFVATKIIMFNLVGSKEIHYIYVKTSTQIKY